MFAHQHLHNFETVRLNNYCPKLNGHMIRSLQGFELWCFLPNAPSTCHKSTTSAHCNTHTQVHIPKHCFKANAWSMSSILNANYDFSRRQLIFPVASKFCFANCKSNENCKTSYKYKERKLVSKGTMHMLDNTYNKRW